MRNHHLLTYTGNQFAMTHYTDWGDANNPDIVLCVHGLTRNCRDFDVLAETLSSRFRVISVDIVGRGNSDWLEHASGYNYSSYLAQLGSLISHLQPRRLRWVGTSMGGVLGMLMAGLKHSPVHQLVVGDVGPLIPAEALHKIASYVGKCPTFTSLTEVELYLRDVHRGFGNLTDAQWQHLAQHSSRQRGDALSLAYDPRIATSFEGAMADVDLSPVWHAVQCPVLVLRGADSRLLPRKVALEMADKDKVQLREFPNVGHAPMMMSEDQISAVMDFLN